MANELNLNNGITGLTVTARLYSGSTQIGSTISMTEVSGALGRYTGSMPSTAAGVYGVLFYAAGAQIGSGKIEWDGSTEITTQTSTVISAAVWNSLTTTSWAANSFGKHAIISSNTNRSIGVTGAGSGHVQCVVHEMNPDVLNASALATDAVSEITAAVATILLVDGPTYKIQVNSDNSVNSTGGGGGGGTVTGFSVEALAQLAPTITIVQPVITINSTTGLPIRIEIAQGADYNSTDGTQITLTLNGTFPAWTGATAYLDIDCGTTLTVAGTITTATGGTRVATFNLTAAQTALLTDATETRNEIVSDVGWFDLRVVLAGSSRVTKPISKAIFIARRPA